MHSIKLRRSGLGFFWTCFLAGFLERPALAYSVQQRPRHFSDLLSGSGFVTAHKRAPPVSKHSGLGFFLAFFGGFRGKGLSLACFPQQHPRKSSHLLSESGSMAAFKTAALSKGNRLMTTNHANQKPCTQQ
jgi:hypothetical protein